MSSLKTSSLEKVAKIKEKIKQLNDEVHAAENDVFRRVDVSLYSESDAGASILPDVPPAKRARLSEAGVGRSTPVPARRNLNFAAEPGQSPGVLVCSLYSCLHTSHEDSTTIAEGYNGFHARFSKFTGKIFDCDCNVQLSTAIQFFNAQLRFQLSTAIQFFNAQVRFRLSTTIQFFNSQV